MMAIRSRLRCCNQLSVLIGPIGEVPITTPEATNTAPPVLTRGPGAAPGGATSKNGQRHICKQRGVVSNNPQCLFLPFSVCVCVCLSVATKPPLVFQPRFFFLRGREGAYLASAHLPAANPTPSTLMPPSTPRRNPRPTHACRPPRRPWVTHKGHAREGRGAGAKRGGGCCKELATGRGAGPGLRV